MAACASPKHASALAQNGMRCAERRTLRLCCIVVQVERIDVRPEIGDSWCIHCDCWRQQSSCRGWHVLARLRNLRNAVQAPISACSPEIGSTCRAHWSPSVPSPPCRMPYTSVFPPGLMARRRHTLPLSGRTNDVAFAGQYVRCLAGKQQQQQQQHREFTRENSYHTFNYVNSQVC